MFQNKKMAESKVNTQSDENEDEHIVYGTIAERGVAIVIDLIICGLITAGLEAVLQTLWAGIVFSTWTYCIIAFVYCVVLISQRFNATVGMAIVKIRIIHVDGSHLNVSQAVCYTLGKFASLYAIMMIVFATVKNESPIMSVIGFILLLIPIFHRQHKALHNILLRTAILRSSSQAIYTEDLALYQQQQPRTWRDIVNAIGNLVVLVGLLWTINVGVTVAHHRDIISRTIYAVNKAAELKRHVEKFYIVHDYFPDDEIDILAMSEIAFPAGGGARVEKGGVITIWFDKLPELKDGKIRLIPAILDKDNKATQWTCKTSDIMAEWLPRQCKARKSI